MPSTMRAETRVMSSRALARASGLVASSAPTTNSSRWMRRTSSLRRSREGVSVPACSSADSSARARPRAATASSTAP